MKQKIKALLTNKELYWTIVFQVTSLVGGVLLIKLLAISLSTKDYGYYVLITSITTFVMMLPFSALMQGIARYISIYQQKRGYHHFFSSIIIIFSLLIGIYLSASMLFYENYHLTQEWQSLYIWIVFYTISEIIKALFRTINNAKRERQNVAIAIVLEFALKLGIIFFSFLANTITIQNTLIALMISNIVAILSMFYSNREELSFQGLNIKKAKIYLLRIWIFSYPLIIWAVFGWLRDMSNRWYLDYFLNKEQVALFAMMGSLALLVPFALQGLIGNFFIPILYQNENFNKGYTRRFLLYLLPSVFIFFLVIFGGVYLFKNEIIMVLADTKYLKLSWMLPWMFLIYSIYVIAMMSTYELFAHNQTRKLIFSSIVPGIISFIGGYFLIKMHGVEGAFYNYALTYLSYSLFTFYVVYQYGRKRKQK